MVGTAYTVLPFDPRKMFDSMGNLKSIAELDEEERAAVARFGFYEHFEGNADRGRQ